MQIQFNTGVCTILMVKVPQGTNHRILDFSSRKDIPMQILVVTVQDYRWHHDLKGKWQFIGLSHELTEEQCKPLVRNYGDKVFENYHSHDGLFQNAKESFESLLRHLKVYNVNPVLEKDPCKHDRWCAESCQGNCWPEDIDFDKWEEAQYTVGTWAVLRLEE